MSTSRAHWPLLLLPAGLAWAWLAGLEQRRMERPWTFLVSDVLPGLVVVAAGLVIWWHRPHNRCWWMLVAAGAAWYVGDFQHAANEDVPLLAFAFAGWYGALLAWAVLAYPSGRLERRASKLLTSMLLALVTMRSAARLFLHVPPDVAGFGTQNRFLPISDDRWWRTVEDVFAWTYAAAMLLVVVAVGRRWAESSRPGRRMLSSALFASAVLAAAVSYEYAIGWNVEISPGTGLRIFYLVWWSHAVVAVALVVGLVRLRRTRSAVVDLVAELGLDAPSARLGDALARALGDPSFTLVPWSPAANGYVDGRGRRFELSVDQPNRAVTLIEHQGSPLAALVHDAALLEDPGLVNAVVATVRLTIDNERLHAEIQTQLAELAASRSRIMAAGDLERQRIERDLHDGAQQRLVTIALALRLAQARHDEATDPRTAVVLSQAVKDLGQAIGELRDLARGIHPAILSEAGLRAALESLVDRTPLPITLHIDLDHEPPSEIAAAAYFAVSR